MSLTLRRQPQNFPHDDPDARWSVYRDGFSVGVIVEGQGRSDEPKRWDWTIHLNAGWRQNGLPTSSGQADTREAAMTAFRHAFDLCLAHIGAEGWAEHIEHLAQLAARDRRWRRQHTGSKSTRST